MQQHIKLYISMAWHMTDLIQCNLIKTNNCSIEAPTFSKLFSSLMLVIYTSLMSAIELSLLILRLSTHGDRVQLAMLRSIISLNSHAEPKISKLTFSPGYSFVMLTALEKHVATIDFSLIFRRLHSYHYYHNMLGYMETGEHTAPSDPKLLSLF